MTRILHNMEKVCVVGAGTMGLDIAQLFSNKGFHITISDISNEILINSKAKLEKDLSKLVAKGKLSEDVKAAIIGNMTFTTDPYALSDMDLIIEAIIERLDIKKSLFSKLEKICKPETIFASNTSSLSITEIASATKRADRFIGLHFFNPATVMKLVEVIRGAHTSDATYEKIRELSVIIGKEPVEVNEAPGFIVNKILVPMINEAIGLYAEGVASVEDIDTAMKLGANHPMGPLALGDLIGLDVCLLIMEVIYSETGDPKYRAHPLLRKMVRAGTLGKKSNKGFYTYSNFNNDIS